MKKRSLMLLMSVCLGCILGVSTFYLHGSNLHFSNDSIEIVQAAQNTYWRLTTETCSCSSTPSCPDLVTSKRKVICDGSSGNPCGTLNSAACLVTYANECSSCSCFNEYCGGIINPN